MKGKWLAFVFAAGVAALATRGEALADAKVLESNVPAYPVDKILPGACWSLKLPKGGRVRLLNLSNGATRTACGDVSDCQDVAPWEQIGGLRGGCN